MAGERYGPFITDDDIRQLQQEARERLRTAHPLGYVCLDCSRWIPTLSEKGLNCNHEHVMLTEHVRDVWRKLKAAEHVLIQITLNPALATNLADDYFIDWGQEPHLDR